MLMYVSTMATIGAEAEAPILSPPLWCIPESFFPSKKLDSLPPRPAQPLLYFSKYPSNLGLKSFEPLHVIKMLVSARLWSDDEKYAVQLPYIARNLL
jgi:integrator complex subunit 6